VNLTGASFVKVDLVAVKFENTNLQGVSFEKSRLDRVIFDKVNLEGVEFVNVDWMETRPEFVRQIEAGLDENDVFSYERYLAAVERGEIEKWDCLFLETESELEVLEDLFRPNIKRKTCTSLKV